MLNGLSLFEGCLFTAARKTKAVSWTTVVGATVGIATCIGLTLIIGALGAAVATVVGYLVTWSTRTVVMTRYIARIKVSWQVEIATLLALILQALLAMQWGMQLIQVPILAAVVFLRRRQLMSICGFVRKKVAS